MAGPLLAHNVFFSMRDNSPAKVQALIDACKRDLTVQPGIVYFACGKLEPELARDVNDRGFDVGLHIVFSDRAAHDAYQDHAAHQRFVADNRGNWKQVRVFDTLVEAVPPRK
jgi:stress responsive alpha/beta barrel protein